MRARPLLAAAACLLAGQAIAFSQSSPITPIGHEWLTAASALELMRESHSLGKLEEGLALKGQAGPDSKALEAALKKLESKAVLTAAQIKLLKAPKGKLGGPQYGAKYYSIWSTVMGQRWIDLGGFRVTSPRGKKCWDAVSQAQTHVQYSHFLRRFENKGGAGALKAIRAAVGRLQLSFISAATADDGDLKFWDGGAASVRYTASRPYFLFGRAAHLFQDSFSPAHGVRDEKDGFRTILGIKSYVCTLGSAQHTHDAPLSAAHDDVIWKKRASTDWSDKNVKPIGIAARHAMKDLWAAFLVAREAPKAERAKVAQVEIKKVIKTWMGFDEKTIAANGPLDQLGKKVSQAFSVADQKKCLRHVTESKAVEVERKKCVAEIGVADGAQKNGFDEDLQIPFNWKNVPKE